MQFRTKIALALCLCLSSLAWAQSRAPAQLLERLRQMDVEHHWLAGAARVDWQTGDPRPGAPPHDHRSTHCSAFVASACQQLGVYILRPPEHSSTLLANAQCSWLGSAEGLRAGWTRRNSASEARNAANQGQLVVGAYQSAHSDKPGHIAIVIPSAWTDERVRREGCEIMQAGSHNYLSTSLKQGFHQHRGAFARGMIQFYAHQLPQGQTGPIQPGARKI